MKEITTRFDLKGTDSDFELMGEEIILTGDESKMKAVRDVLEGRLVKRNVPLKAMTFGDIEKALGGTARQKVTMQKGIPTDKAREIVRSSRARSSRSRPPSSRPGPGDGQEQGRPADGDAAPQGLGPRHRHAVHEPS